jgi:hypothetical protein
MPSSTSPRAIQIACLMEHQLTISAVFKVNKLSSMTVRSLHQSAMRWPFPALIKADEELNSQPSLIKKPFELEELAGLCNKNNSLDQTLTSKS